MSRQTSLLAVLGLAILGTGCADAVTTPRPEGARHALAAGGSVRAVVVFHDTASIPAEGIALLESLGGVVSTRLDSIGVAFAALPELALATVRQSGLVSMVGTDREVNWLPDVRIGGVMEVGGVDAAGHDDPTQVPRWPVLWGLRQIRADAAWAAGYSGSSTVRVAILDTGIDYTNRELEGLVDLGLSRSFVPVTAAPGDHPSMDDHFHGTHVASTVVSNNVTIAGVAPHTSLIAVKVLDVQGSGTFESVNAGIVYAADAGASVINMSLGARLHERNDAALIESMGRAVRYAEKKRTIVISAAGNNGIDIDAPDVFYAPCELSTICVSATGPIGQQDFDTPARYTNFGVRAITVAAPGGNSGNDGNVTEDLILGACSTRTTQPGLAPCRASGPAAYFYAWAAGTSMATPHVSGVAALILAQSPNIPAKALRNKIIAGADDLGAPGRDPHYGYGRVNAYRSLTLN
jgi:lantibiotic leader peptide-processing serine protease